jgi:hypothetical protein
MPKGLQGFQKGHKIWLGKHLSEESKRKISKFHKGRPNGRLGKHHSEETKRKISLAHKGLKPSEESRLRMSVGQKKRFANFPTWNEGTKGICKAWNKGKKFPQISGSKHWHWKGDEVGYFGIHDWIAKEKGVISKCDICGTTNAKKFEWCNKDHKYKRILNDWFRACTSCHRKYDNQNKQLLARIEKLEQK